MKATFNPKDPATYGTDTRGQMLRLLYDLVQQHERAEHTITLLKGRSPRTIIEARAIGDAVANATTERDQARLVVEPVMKALAAASDCDIPTISAVSSAASRAGHKEARAIRDTITGKEAA